MLLPNTNAEAIKNEVPSLMIMLRNPMKITAVFCLAQNIPDNCNKAKIKKKKYYRFQNTFLPAKRIVDNQVRVTVALNLTKPPDMCIA